MQLEVHPDKETLSRAAAAHARRRLETAIARRGHARLVAATGTSQLAFLDALIAFPTIDWSAVELFHLDEYVGLSSDHPASFRRFLIDRLIRPAGITRYHLLDANEEPAEVCARVGRALTAAPIDLLLAGIGENGHLAFNDPPADFDSSDPYRVVKLDEACRRQQVGEGWFDTVEDVPTHAISMSIRQMLAAEAIVCVAPEARKARAVRACFSGGVDPMAPASALQLHAQATVYLDRDSAALLPTQRLTALGHPPGSARK